MYRVIDTVSIDVASIDGYHVFEKLLEESEEEGRGAASAIKEVPPGDWHRLQQFGQ